MKSKFLILFSLLYAPLSCYANLPPNFVYLKNINPSIKQEIRYAGNHNFVGHPMQGYEASECILSREAALALNKVQTELKKSSLSLKVYDCYRPQKAVEEFIAWSTELNKQEMKAEFYPRVNKEDFFKLGYVAKKSGHSRGSTIDLTIVPLHSSQQENYHPGEKLVACFDAYKKRFHDNSIDMGTGYDCMDERAHADNKDINPKAYQHRQLLRAIMEKYGFAPYREEWWHFTLKDEPYPTTYFDFNVSDQSKSLQTLQASQQLLLVLTKDWHANTGTMQRYQRESIQQKWQAIGKAVPIVVGQNGLALGVDLKNSHSLEPIKKEGDQRTPVGIFKLGPMFGFAENPAKTIKMPYLPLTDATFCVDDEKSNYYNQIVEQTKINKPDWHSGEQMRQVPLYKIGAIVAYNQDQPVRGAGSCIFLHIWREPTKGTAGCIAMTESNLQTVLAWLNSEKKPTIAVFTQEEFEKFKESLF